MDDRNYFEEMSLQEQAEMQAAQVAQEIERLLRVCGVRMLNEALNGSGVQLVVKPLPVLPMTALPVPFGQ